MDLLKEAKIEDVYSKISGKSCLNLNITYYQRPYKWPAKKIYNLFEDYNENKRKAGDELDKLEYFFGAVVLVDHSERGDNSKGIWTYQVVDGQQRLTTLFLFNYLRFLLLVRKADILIEGTKTSLEDTLKQIEECYHGFIGENNLPKIQAANKAVLDAVQTAIDNRSDLDKNAHNQWRKELGWVSDPDLSATDYVDVCQNSLAAFFAGENLRLHYSNDSYNKALKEALSKIVIYSGTNYTPVLDSNVLGDVNDESEEVVEWPFIARIYNIFNLINDRCTSSSPTDRLTEFIDLLKEMLSNIKLCMIITSSEDDAFKLFETLNDRSESVSDLELIKDYFYKSYCVTSNDGNPNATMDTLDKKWREDIFDNDAIKDRVAYCTAVFLSGRKDIKQNDAKRKSINLYLSRYNSGNPYTSTLILRDFEYMEYIKKILFSIIKSKKEDNNALSMMIENKSGADASSIVKRALAITVHLGLQAVYAGIICDILYTYKQNAATVPFNDYLSDILNEVNCKAKYLGLWKDCNIMWQTVIMSPNYEKPKLFGDKLIDNCNIDKFNIQRNVSDQLIEYSTISDPNRVNWNDLLLSFETWLGEWKFSDSQGKIKIKNLFIHLYDRYDKDVANNCLKKLAAPRSYTDDSINQDLDHMDARTIDENRAREFFSFDKRGNRVAYTNMIGNMMPLPIKDNRSKHNIPMWESIDDYFAFDASNWLYNEARTLLDRNNTQRGGHKIPTDNFFNERKSLLIKYFKLIVENQKETPSQQLSL